MRNFRLRIIAGLLGVYCATVARAQQPQPTVTVPKLVRFSGSFHPADGGRAQTIESLTLSVYRDQSGGDALWHEIQNVVVDADGHYSVLMGATQNDGIPLDLFASGEPRWLGAQFNRPGEADPPRVLLVSVPYALKAIDAETLGGKPSSAYLLSNPTVGNETASAPGVPASTASAATAAKSKATPPNSGLPNYIGKFVNTTDLMDSVIYQAPVSGNVGVGTTMPSISMDVRSGLLPQMGVAGTADYLTFFASDLYGPAIYWDPAKDMRFGKGGPGLYNPFGFVELMRIKSSNGNVGIGTMAPGSKLDVGGDMNLSGSVRILGSPFLQMPGGMAGNNVALGLGALQNNTTGSGNTAAGASALANNTTGSFNTGGGAGTLQNNTTGNNNTAGGVDAMVNNTTGSQNTATGVSAMGNNTTGAYNTASGYQALGFNIAGGKNTANGGSALSNNTTGSSNIAIGYNAALNVSGGQSNNIHIGSLGSSADNGTVRIGDPALQSSFFAAGIRGVTTTNNDAIAVFIDSAGQLGTKSSSRRFKEDIADMGSASHDLMRLRPVTFRYKKPFADGSRPIQYGLIAEEVAQVYPDLVAHSADGQIETVKYQDLDSMLLNEVQRQQAEIAAQKDELRQLKERLAKLEVALASVSSESSVSGIK